MEGHLCKHTTDWPKGDLMTDKEIISIAQKEDFIVVTKDKDFLNYYLVNGFPPAILHICVGNIFNNSLLKLLSYNLKQIKTLFNSNARLIVLESTRLLIW